MSRSTPEFEESRVADEKQPSILVTIPERLEPLGCATAQFGRNQLGDLDTGMSRIGSRCTRPADHT